MNKKLFLCLFVCCLCFSSYADSFKLLSWNIRDLGRSKDAEELLFMSRILKDYDLIAIQEVVAKDPAGARAIAYIVDNLNRMGDNWDYRVSDPTQSPTPQASERYAFIWRASKIQLMGRPFLDQRLEDICIREPFIGHFKVKGGEEAFYVVNFHSRRFDEAPEKEIQYFDRFPQKLGSEHVFIVGDFNLDEGHEVWETLYYMGFLSAINDSPTTLKRKCVKGNYLNYAIDNIYFDRDVVMRIHAGRVDFVKDCGFLGEAREISDHLPVFLQCELRP